jgi:hypothetical protein
MKYVYGTKLTVLCVMTNVGNIHNTHGFAFVDRLYRDWSVLRTT